MIVFYLTVVTYCASQICIQEWLTRTKIRLLQVGILADKVKVLKICFIKSTIRCASVRKQQVDVVLSFHALRGKLSDLHYLTKNALKPLPCHSARLPTPSSYSCCRAEVLEALDKVANCF